MVSLWALVILSIISLAISSIVSPQIRLARTIEERLASRTAAQSMFRFALFERRNDETEEYDSLFELNTDKYNKLFKPDSETQAVLSLGKVVPTYQLTDEERKININNTVLEEALRQLVAQLGLNSDIVEKIISERPLVIKEQLLLLGVSDEDFEKIKNFITIWSQGQVNINTASKEVLLALGLSEDAVDAILSYRIGADNKEGTEDDEIFKTLEKIISDLILGDADPRAGSIQQAINGDLLTVKSTTYTMDLQTEFLKLPARRYQIVFDNNKILQWLED